MIRLPRHANLSPRLTLQLTRGIAGIFAACIASTALAGPKDQEARQLAEQALFTDYLGTNFAAAKTKLEQAVALCAVPAACSPDVTANVHRDLGVVLIAGLGDTPAGKAQFVQAFQANAAVALDPDLSTEAVVSAFEEARKTAGSAVPATPPPATEPRAVAPAPVAPAPVAPTPATPPPSTQPAAPSHGQPASAPNQPPTTATIDSEVCPPDFPGCDDKSSGGAYCESDLECAGGRVCISNECAAPSQDLDSSKGAANWITAAVQQDFLFLRKGARTLCSSDDYSCYNRDESRFAGETGGFKGGAVVATTRVVLGFDRVLLPFLSVGLRAGFAFRGAPEDFKPYHVEARAAYWFGEEPFGAVGLRPYAFVGGGIGEIDGTIPVKDAAGEKHDAWRQAGLNFVALGPGLVYALTRDFGVMAEGKGEFLFPSSQFGASLQGGLTLGF